MDEPDDDNWLNMHSVRCQACERELIVADHSPFEDGYYLYCDRCPLRVDVAIYDPGFEAAKRQLRASGRLEDDEAWLPELLAAVSAQLMPCPCGGIYRDDAPRRCLWCGAVIPGVDVGQNIWFPNSFDHDAPPELHAVVIREPAWRE